MRRRLSRLASAVGAICLLLNVAGGCANGPASVVPEPPVTPIDVVIEMDSGLCPASADYIELEVEGYFEGIRSMRGTAEPDPEPWWVRWFGCVFSLECWRESR